MSEEIKVVEQELSELLQVRRDKLKVLQDEGRDPFQVTKFNRTAFSAEVIEKFDELEEKPVSVATDGLSNCSKGRMKSSCWSRKYKFPSASNCNLERLLDEGLDG